MKQIKTLALALLLTGLAALPAAAIDVGEPAPDFELKNLAGETIRLSDYRGRPILLKLATTWCPTCKEQTREAIAAGNLLKAADAVFLEVFVQDSEKMIAKYLEGKDYPMEHQALMDDGSAYDAYSVYLIPRVLVIDREFVVRRDGSVLRADEMGDYFTPGGSNKVE